MRQKGTLRVDHAREFVVLADTLNVTRAADILGIAQSTLSKHVAAIERDLGVVLFDRTPTGVKLTRDGSQFYDRARRIVSAYDDLPLEDVENRTAQVDTLMLGGNSTVPSIVRFTSRLTALVTARDAHLRFVHYKPRSISGDMPAQEVDEPLESGKTDLALCIVPANSYLLGKFSSVHLFDEPASFTVLVSNPLAQRRGLRLADLADQNISMFSIYPDCPGNVADMFDRGGARMLQTTVHPVTDLLEVTEHISCMSSLDLHVLPVSLSHEYAFDGSVTGNACTLDVDDPQAYFSVFALYRRDDRRDSVARAVSLIRELAGMYDQSMGDSSILL